MTKPKQPKTDIEDLANSIHSLSNMVAGRFNKVDKKIDDLDDKVDRIDLNLRSTVERLDSHGTRITKLEAAVSPK